MNYYCCSWQNVASWRLIVVSVIAIAVCEIVNDSIGVLAELEMIGVVSSSPAAARPKVSFRC